MDKRQLRQSAVADFMESLEQLNELWDSETESTIWDETAKVSKADQASRHSSGSAKNSSATTTRSEPDPR